MKNAADLRKDERGQMHVLEVMIGGLLILGAIQAGVDMTGHAGQKESGTEALRALGNDALRTLFHLPPRGSGVDPADYDNSSLVYSVIAGRPAVITDFLNSTLPVHVSYRVSVENYSMSNESIGSRNTVLYRGPVVLGETARSHFIFHHRGNIYDVQLLMWYLSRGSGA